jgi:hypothetical protein
MVWSCSCLPGRRPRSKRYPSIPQGPAPAHGPFLLTVENLVQCSSDAPIFSDAVLSRYDVSMNGHFTGTLYEKLGSIGNLAFPASGTIVLNPDCSYASRLYRNICGTPVTIDTRSGYFDQGEKLYWLQASHGGTQYSFEQGQRVGW